MAGIQSLQIWHGRILSSWVLAVVRVASPLTGLGFRPGHHPSVQQDAEDTGDGYDVRLGDLFEPQQQR